MSPQVLALGFEHGVHYLAYTVDTLDEIVDWVLDEKNMVEVNKIRRRGFELARRRHTYKNRAEAIVDAVEKVINGTY